MAMTQECKNAMIEHGVLMNGDVPAGAELLSKPVLRVALVQADENGQYPDGFFNDDVRAAFNDPIALDYVEPARFDEIDMEGVARKAISFWRGDVEFVDFNDNPDVTIFAFDSLVTASFATHPLNDDPETFHDSEKPFIGISALRHQETTGELIRHEFGHSIGIMHPNQAIEQAYKADPELCQNEIAVERAMPLESVQGQPGIMSYGEPEASFYDIGTLQTLQGITR